jgi:hypothetical protein
MDEINIKREMVEINWLRNYHFIPIHIEEIYRNIRKIGNTHKNIKY